MGGVPIVLLVGIFRFVYENKIEYDYNFSNYCRYEKSKIPIVGDTMNNKKTCVLLERCTSHCSQQIKKKNAKRKSKQDVNFIL